MLACLSQQFVSSFAFFFLYLSSVCVYIYVHAHVNICVCVCVCVFAYMYVHVCVCVCVCTCVCVFFSIIFVVAHQTWEIFLPVLRRQCSPRSSSKCLQTCRSLSSGLNPSITWERSVLALYSFMLPPGTSPSVILRNIFLLFQHSMTIAVWRWPCMILSLSSVISL